MKSTITRSRGNVFEDLGFPAAEAENLRIRAGLMLALRNLIEARHMKQREAAELFNVTQPRISDLVRGRIERFSIDMLVNMLARGNVRVDVHVEPLSA